MGKYVRQKRKTNKKLSEQHKKLTQSYYSPQHPGSYGGINALQRVTKLKHATVKDFLAQQDTYTLHAPIRHNFDRRRVIVGGIDHQWQADLIDVQQLKKENSGYSYLLTVIDVLSKYAWVVPLKNKTGVSVITAFTSIFDQGRKPLKLQSDKGSEFLNRPFQKFLKEENVAFFSTQNEDIKASIVERFNRTIKEKLWRYFTKTNTLKYIDVLPLIVQSYNHTFHRSIQRAPSTVTTANQEEVWQTLYGHFPKHKPSKYSVGDRVRISKARKVFKKGYLPSWSEELFTISSVLKTTPVTYTLIDDHGEELIGSFYEQEIQKVAHKEVFRIETVLKHRSGPKQQRQYLVKWYGYPSTFNSWIPELALTTYTS